MDEIVSETCNELCEPCKEDGESKLVISYCRECPEYLCEVCKNAHRKQKATKAHNLITLTEIRSIGIRHKPKLCDPCGEGGQLSVANNFCKQCDQNICYDCAKSHTRQQRTKSHKLVEIKETAAACDPISDVKAPERIHKPAAKPPDRPDKPHASDVKADSLTLCWGQPEIFGKGEVYQIRYKDLDDKGNRWKFHSTEPSCASVLLSDLKANTKYIFQVRVVHEEGEGPYSPQSDEILTMQSPAARIVAFSKCKVAGKPSPSLYTLPVTEIRDARNSSAKSRKFEVGSPPYESTRERTIILVGATGTGKSTLVDGLVNYILGVNWNDPFRFTVIDLEHEELTKKSNQALSQTEWITCYTLNPEQGSRLGYKLTIIDTPGFGDTRGLERDQELVSQIRKLFSEKGAKGVMYLDAVCFLIKAPDARLTVTQTYIFQSIMALFGKDIEQNICSLVTFADGDEPPVLAALKASKLPFGQHFTFNNSALVTKNVDLNSSSLSPMFWEMGCKSFQSFFDHIEKMSPKSLQQTKQVLEERKKLEDTVLTLQPFISIGLSKIETLKEEARIIDRHKTDIKAHKDFEIEVTEFVHDKLTVPKGLAVTNCTICNTTCHRCCGYPNDEDKMHCCAMDHNGNCRVCDKKCRWDSHANTPYFFEIRTVKKTQTLAEKLAKYTRAGMEVKSHEQIMKCMQQELLVQEKKIMDLVVVVKKCNERLSEIALRPHPLNMVEYIDTMMKAEEQEKREGYKQRIDVLIEFRRKAEIEKDVQRFNQGVRQVAGPKPQKKGFLGLW